MLVAVNNKNIELIPANGKWVCDQGKLLYEIEKNPTLEVFIDEELPGALRIDDLVAIIQKKYPLVRLTRIQRKVKKQSCLPYLGVSIGTGVLAILLFILLSQDFSGNSFYAKNLYISVGVAMSINFFTMYLLKE